MQKTLIEGRSRAPRIASIAKTPENSPMRITPLAALTILCSSFAALGNEPPETRTIQIPYFENGKFSGYVEEKIVPDREPSAFETKPGDVLTINPESSSDENTDTAESRQ